MLTNGVLFGIDSESLSMLFCHKDASACYLHRLSMEDDIRHFVMYSSITAKFGNDIKTNNAASNSYLDALVHVSQMQGFPGTSITITTQ